MLVTEVVGEPNAATAPESHSASWLPRKPKFSIYAGRLVQLLDHVILPFSAFAAFGLLALARLAKRRRDPNDVDDGRLGRKYDLKTF